MSFRCDTAIGKARKAGRCAWCWERIDTGSPAVSISGVYDGDFSCVRLHPECWRAEYYGYWRQASRPEEWPEQGSMFRGTILERDCVRDPLTKVWPAVPVTKDEIRGKIQIND